MKSISILICILFSCGCVRTFDVTSDIKYHAGYKPGQVYITQKELVLRQFGSKYFAVPGKNAPTIQLIHENPGKWKDILGVIPSGTKFQISELKRELSFEFDFVSVFALVLDGKFKAEIVDLNSISNFDYQKTSSSLPIPDSEYIQLVTDH